MAWKWPDKPETCCQLYKSSTDFLKERSCIARNFESSFIHILALSTLKPLLQTYRHRLPK